MPDLRDGDNEYDGRAFIPEWSTLALQVANRRMGLPGYGNMFKSPFYEMAGVDIDETSVGNFYGRGIAILFNSVDLRLREMATGEARRQPFSYRCIQIWLQFVDNIRR